MSCIYIYIDVLYMTGCMYRCYELDLEECVCDSACDVEDFYAGFAARWGV